MVWDHLFLEVLVQHRHFYLKYAVKCIHPVEMELIYDLAKHVEDFNFISSRDEQHKRCYKVEALTVSHIYTHHRKFIQHIFERLLTVYSVFFQVEIWLVWICSVEVFFDLCTNITHRFTYCRVRRQVYLCGQLENRHPGLPSILRWWAFFHPAAEENAFLLRAALKRLRLVLL
jgi:hypothetical protein